MNRLNLAILSLLSAVIMVPALLRNDLILASSKSTDQASHLAVISQIQFWQEIPVYTLYWGQMVLGYPMVFLYRTLGWDLKTQFIVLNALAVVGVIFTLYFVVGNLVNKTAGLLAVIATVFCAKGIFIMFTCSVTFGIINLFIILPIGVYFMAEWFDDMKPLYALLSVVLFGLFSIFHTTGLYLAPVMGLFISSFLVYGWIRKQNLDAKRVLSYGLAVIGMNLLLVYLLLPHSGSLIQMILGNVFSPFAGTVATVDNPPSLGNFIGYSSLPVIVLFVVLTIGLIIWRKIINAGDKLIVFVLFFGSLAVELAIATFSGMTIEPTRTMFDLGSSLAIVASCLAGILFSVKAIKEWVPITSLALAGTGAIPVLNTLVYWAKGV